jgi:toxin ParE1/3/4
MPGMRVRLTPAARATLDEILDRILRENRFAAQRYRDKIARTLRRIGQFPRSGHSVPEFPRPDLRQVIVDPYRFFYTLDEGRKTVWVVAVWHGAQIPAEPHAPSPTH